MNKMERIFGAFTLRDLHNSLIIQKLMEANRISPKDIKKHIKETAITLAEPFYVQRRKKHKRTKAEAEARRKMLKETIYGPIKPGP